MHVELAQTKGLGAGQPATSGSVGLGSLLWPHAQDLSVAPLLCCLAPAVQYCRLDHLKPSACMPPPEGMLSYCTWAQEAISTKTQKENGLVSGLKDHRYLSVTRVRHRGASGQATNTQSNGSQRPPPPPQTPAAPP